MENEKVENNFEVGSPNDDLEVVTLEEDFGDLESENVSLEVQNKPPKKSHKKLIMVLFAILFIGSMSVLGLWITNKTNLFSSNKENSENIDKPGETPDEDKEKEPVENVSNETSLVDFDLDFLKLENKEENVVYSPLSIRYALLMLRDGADGDTKKQIDNLIQNYNGKKYVNSQNMAFANALFIRDTYKNNIKSGYVNTLKNNYNAEVIYDSFQTPANINSWVKENTLGLVDFKLDDISDYDFALINALAINMDWKKAIQYACGIGPMSASTFVNVDYKHEKFSYSIPYICDENYPSLAFNDDTMKAKAVQFGAIINNYDIVNVLGRENIRSTIKEEYIKFCQEFQLNYDEDSVNEFVENYIEELDSNYKNVFTSTDFMIYVDDNVKAFAKDLKEYNGMALQYIGIMPIKQNLGEYIKNVTSKDISYIINNLKEPTVENFSDKSAVIQIDGHIPLFQFEYDLNLQNDLKTLGVVDVFNSATANLSNLVQNSHDVYIDKILHKTNIEFSNEGIKAAATTGGFGGGAAGTGSFEYLYDVPVEIIDMTFDKPYLFLIRDKNSGEVWFVGKVYKPTKNKENTFGY